VVTVRFSLALELRTGVCFVLAAEEQRKSAAEAALFCYLGAYAKGMSSSLSAAL
jgi:hypothetical protein